ncbi:hypothetical protein [Sandaracinus amylolyticus]|uniref:hypothetical protein n=1 Tax=Sandaracinus amylolyticus TaxID=927083 RepID=UPI001F2B7866|nr:hypothetical protein [Sandaracinus amylolyticus]UJR81680.1 Hypothetical protein I5071_37400 [Sandaracinus amylolyticus]
MSFRDDRDALRHRNEALEREVEALREERDAAHQARDRALADAERARKGEIVDAPHSAYRVGEKVIVEWRGSWWDATVVGVVGPREWRVHYDGWSSSWDENVGPTRILPRAATPPGPRAGKGGARAVQVLFALLVVVIAAVIVFVKANDPPDPPASVPGAYATPGTALTASDVLSVGAPVWVEWHGTWYRATVLQAYADGSARIHYDGWSDTFDETAARSRIRRP